MQTLWVVWPVGYTPISCFLNCFYFLFSAARQYITHDRVRCLQSIHSRYMLLQTQIALICCHNPLMLLLYSYNNHNINIRVYHLCLPAIRLQRSQRPPHLNYYYAYILLLLLLHNNIIYAYLPFDYTGHRGHNPLMLLLYLYYSYYYYIRISSMPTYLLITWATEATTHLYY